MDSLKSPFIIHDINANTLHITQRHAINITTSGSLFFVQVLKHFAFVEIKLGIGSKLVDVKGLW